MPPSNEARILHRPEHSVSRQDIDTDALKVLYRLHRNGFKAFLVGGSVRDLLIGSIPKDFDIATDATPEDILDLFRNSRIIGRRFPIVHVMFGRGKVMEVATFRALDVEEDAEGALPTDQDSMEEEALLEEEADLLVTATDSSDEDDEDEDDEVEAAVGKPALRREERRGRRRYNDRGRHLLEFADQRYGSPAEDARRRDLTVNGLFYDIADFSVIDYVGGLDDLNARRIRTIGDPDQRFTSDPVRMIRALRHAGRMDFRIDAETWSAIGRQRERLKECSKARVLEEFYRDLRGGAALPSLRLMRESGVLPVLLPALESILPPVPEGAELPLPWKRLELLDRRIGEDEAFSNAWLLALLLSQPLLDHLARLELERGGAVDYGRSAYRYLKPMTSQLGVARRDNERLFLIAISQRRLEGCRRGQPIPGFFRNKPYFSEAFELFKLDSEARGLELPPLEFGSRGGRRRSRRRRRSRSAE